VKNQQKIGFNAVFTLFPQRLNSSSSLYQW